MCHGLLPLEWQVILGQDRLLSANKKYGESILTILTLDVENLPCFGVRGGLRHNPGESNLMFWRRGTRSRVPSGIFLRMICLVTRYSKMQKRHSIC
jgi:hypothetical protein